MDINNLVNQKTSLTNQIINAVDLPPSLRDEAREYVEYALFYMYEGLFHDNQHIVIQFFQWFYTTLSYDGLSKNVIKTLLKDVIKSVKSLYAENDTSFFEQFDVEKIINQSKPQLHQLNEDAQTYLNFLLDKDKLGATQFIRKLLDDGREVPDIYINILQVALYEIGALWQANKITVADEHLATVITQYVMTTIYPTIFSTTKNNHKVLGAAIGSEFHEIGIRMVMDLYEYAGYQTQYLGANLPIDAFISFAKEFQPDIIALSITLSVHLKLLKETIRRIRANESLKNVKIIVGGQALGIDDSISQTLDADGYAKDAYDALEVGESLVKST